MIAKTSCQHCGIHIEFDVESVNEFITCPSCGNQTRLLLPTSRANVASVPIKRNSNSKAGMKLLLVIVALPLVAILSWKIYDLRVQSITHAIAPLELPNLIPTSKDQLTQTPAAREKPLSAEEKTSRENILKALFEVQSATSLGVTHNRYGELLVKADSTLNFEKTKLSDFRHYRFISDAEKAIHYYSKAKDEWSDYFKYDWMRESDETLLGKYSIDDLHEAGVDIDLSKYLKDSDGFYRVPFKSCLSWYWKASDTFIERLKDSLTPQP